MFLDIDQKNNDRPAAIAADGGTLTYGELIRQSEVLEQRIGTRNLGFILCRNRLGALAAYVSMMNTENVPLLLSADMDRELLEELLATYHPGFVCCPDDMGDEMGAVLNRLQDRSTSKQENGREQFGAKAEMPWHDEAGLQEPVLNCLDYVFLRTSWEKTELHDSLALLLTTSGSTGSPKLVRQSMTNVVSNAAAIAEYLELDETERPITMLPMNYTYGLSVINSHLLVGATILMTESSYAQKPFWDFFKDQKATSMAGVPFTYEILKKLRFFRMELPSLRYMTQAGGKLLPELHREYAEYAKNSGKRFYVMYGQTEATARMAYLPCERSLEKYGSMGIAIPGGEFSLIDVNGDPITDEDVVGELVYRGPNVTLGYAERLDDLKKGDERNGLLVTGDMAKRDAEGFYYIVGRKKRFLKIYGNRVNLDECERMLQGQFPESETACVGEDDHMRIYLTVQGLEREVIRFLSEKTGLNFKAFDACYIPEIPKNDSGKKNYQALAEGEG